MQKRKWISLLLALAMMLSLLPTGTIAADAANVCVGGANVNAGETFSVDISIENNPGFANFQLKVVYDQSMLELKAIDDSSEDFILRSELVSNPEEGILSTAAAKDNTKNGVIATLTFEAKSAAKGKTTVSVQPVETEAAALKNYGFSNAAKSEVPVTFVPGTVTVKASTAERTVKFVWDVYKTTYTVPNGGTLSQIPAAPTAPETGWSFLGWYAVEGTDDYLLNNVDETITGTEASTETAIYTDTTYQAIWASSDMIAAGYAADASGKTTIGVEAAISGLQNFVNSYTGGTVKLLKNVDLAKGYEVIQSGTTVTLDLNGKTLSANGVSDDTTNWKGYGPIVNNGNLALISSTALTDKGVVQLNETAGVAIEGNYGALTNHGTVRMENVKIVSTSTFIDKWDSFFPACAYYGDATATITTIQNCELHANRNAALYQYSGSMEKLSDSVFESSAKSVAVFLEGWGKQQHYGTIENCTITLHCDDPESSAVALKVYCGTLESVTGCTITGPNGILLEDYAGDSNISPEIRTLNSTVEGTNGYAIKTDSSGDRKPVINFTGGKYKGAKGVEKYEGSTAITYPAGQKLVAGEDGWYTLQTAYTVTFKNGDTALQTVTCGKNGTAAYTGVVPTKDADETYTYTFNGKWADGSGKVYANNQVTNVTADLTVTAQFDTASARVVTLTVDGNSKNYTGLKAAADALNDSGDYKSAEIKLNENDTETEPVTVTKSVTIDLNGHNLTANTAENGITVSGGATLTFKDSAGTGVFKHTATRAEKSAILANGSGTVVNIESGTIEATKGNALTVSDAAFHISGGTIIGGNNGIYVTTQSASPVCTVAGGKIICKGNGCALNMDDAAIAGNIQLSGGAFKNTVNPTELIRNQDKCAFQDGKSLSPSPNTKGFYEVREVGTYTLVLTADEEHYNAGETVTVTVSAYGSAASSINSFGFTPGFDSSQLTLKNVTSVNPGLFTVNPQTGKTGYTVSGSGLSIGTTATPLVKITFTAKAGINASAAITLNDLEMTKSGTESGDTVSAEGTTVNLHDLRVTLTAKNGTINGSSSALLYAKYGEKALYSGDVTRNTAASVTVAAVTGYRLADKQWKCGETEYTDFAALLAGETFTESKTFELQTLLSTFDFKTTGSSFILTGKKGISADNKVTFGQDVTFQVTPNAGYVVTNVWYSVGGGASQSLAAENGVYTIPGDKITGDVTVEVVTVQYFTVTFRAGTGSTLTGETTAYAMSDARGLYTDTTFKTRFAVPTPAAAAGYRLNDAVLWSDGTNTYTAETVKSAAFTADTTLTAQSIKLWTVTFAAGEHGTLSGSTAVVVDENTTLGSIADKPTVTPAPGYAFDQWDKADATVITADITVTALYKNGTYSITFPDSAIVTVSDMTGITAGKVTHDTAASFKLTVNHGYLVTKVTYQVAGQGPVTVDSSTDGTYMVTIPGAGILGNIVVSVESKETADVTFEAGANGSVSFTSKTVVKGEQLGAGNVPTVTPTAGYRFDGWYKRSEKVADIAAETISAAVTYTAKFVDETYRLNLSEGLTLKAADGNSITSATHGTDLTFTPAVEGKLVIGITAKIGGQDVAVTKTGNSYTIAGKDILGNLTFTARTIDGSWTFIEKGTPEGSGYVALANDTKIALLTAGKLDSGNYLLGSEGMYWSGKYDAYVKIVGSNETADTLTARLTLAARAQAQEIGYTGDINGSNSVTPADGGMINDVLHSATLNYTLTEKQRLEMDVNGDRKVTTADIQIILYRYVGLSGDGQ